MTGGADGGTGPTVGACRATIKYTTQSANKGYSPKNYTAAWIVGPAGEFVKTLVYAKGGHDGCLKAFSADLTKAKLTKSSPMASVDAVTSATRNKALPGNTMDAKDMLTATWNCTDYAKMPVPAGAYQLCMEMCETNGASPKSCVPFMVGNGPVMVTAPDEPLYKGRSLDLVPGQ